MIATTSASLRKSTGLDDPAFRGLDRVRGREKTVATSSFAFTLTVIVHGVRSSRDSLRGSR
ncbi:MAG: hypothetical protein HC834_10285 [Rhodospirillales bacterium]|nr:hypothetical protein [Rhodospirillales bacterium]